MVNLLEKVLTFIGEYDSFILTTHDPADPDGLGAELTFAHILKTMGKEFRIINASPVAPVYKFIDKDNLVETWDRDTHNALLEKSALLILDTSDEYTLGNMRETIGLAREAFFLDHHEPPPQSVLHGVQDSGAAATSELAVEIAINAGVELDEQTASAAYAGLAHDSGFFCFPKTTGRSFGLALYLVNRGAIPNRVFHELSQSASTNAILLQKRVLSSLELAAGNRVAVQVMRKEDLLDTGACFEDAENFINVPLKAKDIAVSILIKENVEGKVRCSLRSKGKVNVSKIAQGFSGGGHVTAAGFRSSLDLEETLHITLKSLIEKIESQLDVL
jgi:phosphoesterase RecJ-like protein